MFLPRSEPPVVREAQLRELRLAMNTPHLRVPDLPAGPAQAAILVYEQADGVHALCVLVRSLSDGSLLCWSWEEATDSGALLAAVEAALSFGEAMGFLFDDDALGAAIAPEERRRALGHLWEMSGWPPPDVAPEPAAQRPVARSDSPAVELLEAQARLADRLPLTKFRRRPEPAPAPAAVPAAAQEGAALGRVRLVKRIAGEAVGDRLPRWLRLFGSY